MRTVTRLAVLAVILVAAAGCQGRRSNITGTVTRDGQPLEWPFEGGHFLVIFVPENDPTRDPVRAETDRQAGTFRVTELKAGAYMVAVHMFDDKHMDVLKNKFDPAHTPIRVEVTEDNQVINVDLPKDLPK